MYSIKMQHFDNVFDVLYYTVSAMKECKYSYREIEDYLKDAVSSNNCHLIDSSIRIISECNKVYRSLNDDCQLDESQLDRDYWREYYYCNDEDYDDELEAYEGFDCCKLHQYNFLDYDLDDKCNEDTLDYSINK